MEEKQIASLQSLLNEKENIFIFPFLKEKEDSLLASLALFYSLENSGQKANLILGTLPWSVQPFAVKSFSTFQPKIIIRPPSSTQIKQLRYEEKNRQIIIYLDAEEHLLDQKNFDFILSPQPQPDLLITLNAQKTKDIVSPVFQNNFNSQPLVNIDHHPSNQQFGQINLVQPSSSSLCEWLTEILRQINEDWIDSHVAAYLLQGIKLLPSEKQSKSSLSQMHYLIGKGALDFTLPFPLLTSQNQIDFLQKIIEKIQVSLKPELAFVLLDVHEFHYVSPPYLSLLIKELKSGLFHFDNLLVLWAPDRQTVQGIISLKNQKKWSDILEKLNGTKRGNVGLFRITGTNLSSVKTRIWQLLSEESV